MSTKPMINPSRDQTPSTAWQEDAATVPTSDLSAMTTIVVGASRGLGRGISTAVAEAGAPVIAVARTPADLAGAANIQRHVADAGDPTVAGNLLDLSWEDMDWITGINFTGVLHGTKFFLPHLIASGDGHVVNLSSLFGLLSIPGQSMYNAAKYAVRGMTESCT